MPTVYDYVAGKMDWLGFGLPHDGTALLVSEVARRDLPTCCPGDAVESVLGLLQEAEVALCPVIDGHGVVLGAVHRKELEKTERGTPAEEVMEVAMSTIRPSAELHTLLDQMEQARTEATVITRPDGTLFGLAVRSQVRRVL
ncbi:MAG: CBS domain-containing protein [Acidimicrobiales bacterium]|nr:CBS domain-containing protein [Acidimicrobiales bacterium]MBO0892949.1 CBS domain-containing protein [Acidimicrobiales bacterium]